MVAISAEIGMPASVIDACGAARGDSGEQQQAP